MKMGGRGREGQGNAYHRKRQPKGLYGEVTVRLAGAEAFQPQG